MIGAIIQHLLETADLTHLTQRRIRPGKMAPNDTAPMIRVRRLEHEPQFHMGGDSGLARDVYEFDCQACGYLQAERMAAALEAAAAAYKSQNSGTVQGCFPADSRVAFVADPEDPNKGKHVARQLWTIWHRTAA